MGGGGGLEGNGATKSELAIETICHKATLHKNKINNKRIV